MAKKKKPAAKKSAPPKTAPSTSLVPQSHGGALRQGGNPGNKGGGRLPGAIRDALRGSFDKRIQNLEEIADGVPVQTIRIAPSSLAPYVACADCGGNRIRTNEAAAYAEITVESSARPVDRLGAIEMLAKYGLGPLKEVSIDSVRERVTKTLDIIQTHVSPEQYKELVRALEPVWS